ncbi:MAG: hypothetical protein KAR17_21070 [Cyclobacteriaceae bacterium]|nr:hypothetical protein [Cyclobacteriaceae bacterium]
MKKKSVQSGNPFKSVIQTSYDIIKAHEDDLTMNHELEMGAEYIIKIPLAL